MADSKKQGVDKHRRRLIVGDVVACKMNKTVVVQATRQIKHPMYGKYYKDFSKFKTHDEKGQCEVGDRVEIIESRPISKHKRFRLYRIVEKVERVGGASAASEVKV